MTVTLHVGDCREALATMPDASVDSIVTDPPYELGFMGKTWDSSGIAYDAAMWAECLRVLKPGGHLLAFGGTRTYHRMTCAIEDAGFEIRDSIHWIYGSGFPKSLDVSKAIDKARTEDKEPTRVVCRAIRAAMEARGLKSRHLVEHFDGCHPRLIDHWAARDTDSQPALPTWEQWETLRGLFPELSDLDGEAWRLNGRKGSPGEAWEAREVTGTVEEWSDRTAYALTSRDGLRRDIPATPQAAAWSGWGTALKPAHEPIVVARKPLVGTVAANVLAHGTGALNIDGCRVKATDSQLAEKYASVRNAPPRENSVYGTDSRPRSEGNLEPHASGRWPANVVFDEAAAAELEDSRFFYCAKASSKERPVGPDGTKHATVKPLALMRWLVRLVTPPGGTVLDPFAGSGTTLEAAILEGFDSVGIERDPAHADLCAIRVERSGGQWAVPKGWAA